MDTSAPSSSSRCTRWRSTSRRSDQSHVSSSSKETLSGKLACRRIRFVPRLTGCEAAPSGTTSSSRSSPGVEDNTWPSRSGSRLRDPAGATNTIPFIGHAWAALEGST
eukprot:scaffold30678_cov108-Isochrysis_galbana.AAC.3